MKICINRLPRTGPWGGGNVFVSYLFRSLQSNGHSVVTKLSPDIDAIFVVDPRRDELGIGVEEILEFKRYYSKVPIIYRVNECDKRKGEVDSVDPLVRKMINNSTHTIFISKWLRDYHHTEAVKRGQTLKTNDSIILNGFSNIFQRTTPSIPVSERLHVVTHHWSNHPMKGHDVYVKVGEWCERTGNVMTFIGRPAGRLPSSVKIINPLYGAELAETLSKHHVYVTGTSYDPGPNHVAEAIGIGLPTYVPVWGGGAVEMAGLHHTYDSIEQLTHFLELPIAQHAKNDSSLRIWDTVIKDYLAIVDAI